MVYIQSTIYIFTITILTFSYIHNTLYYVVGVVFTVTYSPSLFRNAAYENYWRIHWSVTARARQSLNWRGRERVGECVQVSPAHSNSRNHSSTLIVSLCPSLSRSLSLSFSFVVSVKVKYEQSFPIDRTMNVILGFNRTIFLRKHLSTH